MDEISKKLPQIPHTIPNLQRPTTRVTSVLCELDGGSFVLTLAELRPVQPWTAENRFAGATGFVEVGRFALSPIAFSNLKDALAQAEASYVKVLGPLPDAKKYYEKIASDLPEAEVERRMGFRE
jgi:hypothetical protein